jgi:hypothetical protein
MSELDIYRQPRVTAERCVRRWQVTKREMEHLYKYMEYLLWIGVEDASGRAAERQERGRQCGVKGGPRVRG